MLGYGSAGESTGVVVTESTKQTVTIVINCGSWTPETLMARLNDGGCPHRHVDWVHYPRDKTIRATVNMTEVGRKAMMEWLRLTYVIPAELKITFK